MLAELCRVLTDLGRADQQLERTAQPPAAPGNDQIVDAALGRGHFCWRDVAIPGHFFSYSLKRQPPAVRKVRQYSRSGKIENEGRPVQTRSVVFTPPLRRASAAALVLLFLASCAQLPRLRSSVFRRLRRAMR